MASGPTLRVIEWEIRLPERVFNGALTVPATMSLGEFARASMSWSALYTESEIQNYSVRGMKVSCKRGCGACCRQVAPLSPPEAWMIAEMVAALAPENRRKVRRRFQRALHVLRRQGLGAAPLLSRAMDYFSLGVRCPFLEDECCSIYPDWPSACREYLVTSSPSLCKAPENNAIQFIIPPVRLAECLSVLAGDLLGGGPIMIPLVRALDWTARNKASGRRKWDSAFLVQRLIQILEFRGYNAY